MSLYVRVMNGFYTHRKTIRLRVAIGDAAFWVPPRLWAYASDNQPDGCFEQYSAEELAMLIGYSSNAIEMLHALLGAGFLDSEPLRIHDWVEHNGYHVSYAERAKKAATARWAKSPPAPPPRPDLIVPDGSIASGNASSMDGESVFSKVPKLLTALGELYGRKEGQRATHIEETSAADVVKRGGWEDELAVIRAWHNTMKAEDRRYFPQSMATLLDEWQKNLDRANSNKSTPAKRFGVRGIA